jgi:hypothetical protein
VKLKTQVNPIVVVGIVVLMLAILGFGIWRAGEPGRDAAAKPPGMPADAAAEMQRRMGGASATTAPNPEPTHFSGTGAMTAPPASGTGR